MLFYLLEIYYESGCAFKAFFNNHLFANIKGNATSAERFACEAFFIDGTNTVTIDWRPDAEDTQNENDPKDAQPEIESDSSAITVPDVMLRLRATPEYGKEGKVLFSKEFGPKDRDLKDGVPVNTYTVRFENYVEQDFSPLLYKGQVCNESEKDFAHYQKQMQKFCSTIYWELQDGNYGLTLRSMEQKIRDEAAGCRMSFSELQAMYGEALESIAQDRLDYQLKTPEQFVFLPTCGGRLWNVGVMHEEEDARAIMEEVKMKPHALRSYDKKLIHGKNDGGLSQILPVYIGFVDGQCGILR